MRIAIFAETFLPKVDGIATTLCCLLDHLALRGHQSLMFAPAGAPPRYANTPIVGLPSFPLPLYRELRLVPPGISVMGKLKAFRPDVIHVVNPALLGLTGLHHAAALDVPTVASYHTDLPGYAGRYGLSFLEGPLWRYFRWVHNRATLTLCPSRYTRAELESHGFDRVGIWAKGVDTRRYSPRFRRAAWRKRLTDGHPDAPLLLYVGRLGPEKRVDWLRAVIDALPGARLAIVGDGPARDKLRSLFSGTATVFTGYLRGKDLSCAYAAGDIFCFPSANETFGLVVLEAMSSGLPVIAPRSGGVVDHIIDGQNGFLFAPSNPDDLLARVRQLASDMELTRQLGRQARAYAKQQSWSETLDGLLDDYRRVIHEHREARDRAPHKGKKSDPFSLWREWLKVPALWEPK